MESLTPFSVKSKGFRKEICGGCLWGRCMRLSAARPEPTENDKGLRERAGPAADTMNEAALLLRTYCTDAGLTPLASEWWHFNDLDRLAVVDSSWRGEFALAENVSRAPE